MAYKLGIMSYAFATIASICFVSGLFVLSGCELTHVQLGNTRLID